MSVTDPYVYPGQLQELKRTITDGNPCDDMDNKKVCTYGPGQIRVA